MKIQHYEITQILSEGAFGELYKGQHTKTREQVVIKIEKQQNTTYSLLRNEAKVLQFLYKNGVRKIPAIYWYGFIKERNAIGFIMPFYQYTLLDYIPRFYEINRPQINRQKLNRWMLQCLAIFQSIHGLWVLHRDIKPQNFMVHNGQVILIDFGLATFYDIDKTNEPRTSLIGTPNYASIRIHEGNRSCWRDDLISLGYLYLFVLSGGRELWINDMEAINEMTVTNEMTVIYPSIDIRNPRNQALLENKQIHRLMTSHRDIDNLIEIETYLKYVYSLKYGQIPNYDYINSIFLSAIA